LKSNRFFLCSILFLAAATIARPVADQSASADPGDSQAIWGALAKPAFDAAKIATVTNLVIERDRIHITLESGTLHFTQPVNGIVCGAVFHGSGHLQMSPPNSLESQQLELFVKQDGVNLSFSEAVFAFTDKTFDEIAGKVQWAGASPGNEDLYASRIQANEDLGAAFLPRLFKSVMGTNREKSALFFADVKSSEHGWVETLDDSSEPEDIRVGRWADVGGGKDFDVWMSFPANGRSASSAFDVPYQKADYTIHGYDMDVSVTSSAELSATAKVNFHTRWPGERVLLFSLDSNLRVDKISDEQGSASTYFEAREVKDRSQSYGDYVAVVLPSPTQADQTRILTFHYAGKRVVRQVGPGNYFAESFTWYPTRILNERTAGDEFAGRYDFHLQFQTPKQFALVATGNKISDTVDGKERVTEWKSDIPLAVAGFMFGDYKVVTQKVGDITVKVFANNQPDDSLRRLQGMAAMGMPSAIELAPTIATEMGNALRTFEKYYGPYPYKTLAVTNIPYSYGQGWPGLIYLSIITFLDDTQRHQLGFPPDPRITEFFRAHETSHQWWGHRVGWKSYHDQWLSEGFAQFSGNLYTQFRDDQKKYIQRLKDDREQLLARDDRSRIVDSVGPAWMGDRTSSSLDPKDTSVIIYNKGGYALTMLRMMMEDPTKADPDVRFEAMMHDFCTTFDNKAASTEDFKGIAEKYMTRGMDLNQNHKLDWFFNQYVYGTGIPHYEFHFDVGNAPDNQFKLTGTLKRTGVPDDWKDLVPIFIQHNGQYIQLGFITADRPEKQFTTMLPFNPGKVQINMNEELLAEVKQ
jgi:hypothetical protein